MVINKSKGFTLIELLVVIVLLGIVTSFAVLSMGTGSAERKMEISAGSQFPCHGCNEPMSIQYCPSRQYLLDRRGGRYLEFGVDGQMKTAW